MNLYRFSPEMHPSFLGHEENTSNFIQDQDPLQQNTYNCTNFADTTSLLQYPFEQLSQYHVPNLMGLPLDEGGDPIEVPEIPDTCFNYISNLLREEGSDDRPGATLQDYMTAQMSPSYNNSSDFALLGENCSFLSSNQCPPPLSQCQTTPYCLDDYFNLLSSISSNTVSNTCVNDNFVQNSLIENRGMGINSRGNFESTPVINPNCGGLETEQFDDQAFNLITNGSLDLTGSVLANPPNDGFENEQWDMSQFPNDTQIEPGLLQGVISNCANGSENVGNGSNGKTRGRDEGENPEGEERERSNKQPAQSNEVFDEIEQYGDVLLCPEGRSKPAGLCSSHNNNNNNRTNAQNSEDGKLQKDGKVSSKGSKKKGGGPKKQVIDLRTLLTRCAQCVARVDLTGSYQLLEQIRQHSSPCGDYLQRLAHYLANGLEARLEGKGYELTRSNEQIPPSEILKANRVFVGSVPFKIMSYYTTNKTIASLAEEAQSIHIIEFGIFYGLQWPCIIQNLSKRPNGPPRIRITGIDFPQSGFRPSERVEETGRCLAKYCERYNVPFEYNPIAKNWETITLEELKIQRNEPLVVNCLYRSHNLFDDSVEENSPRDAFLSLIGKINPDIFMHGVVNTTSNVPFFLNRFKEAMFHYTALFDLFEATMGREDQERMILESKLYGKQALNVIACEGVERVERPESYKQWQVRTQRAGFVQVPMDRELLRRARVMVRRNFREEFSYDEDGHWVVQGWKGRIMYAISCWKPS